MRTFLLLVITSAVVLTACGAGVGTAEFTRVDPEAFQAEAASGDATIIDLRTDAEIAEGFIDGAVQMDFYEPTFADDLAELDPGGHYLVYCNSGNRSAQTVRMMKDLGFTHVTELDGGIQAWLAAGLPTVTP